MASEHQTGPRISPAQRLRVIAVGGALLLAGAGVTAVTVANAQTPSPTPRAATTQPSPAPGQGAGTGQQQRGQMMTDFINRLAQNLGTTPDRLRAALQQTALQSIDAAVQNGTMTAEQAQRARERINAGDIPFGPGFGRGGHDGERGGRGGFFGASSELATFLGITQDQLRAELPGKSLAQVAQAHGRSRAQLVQFLVSNAQQHVQSEVQSGRITQAQATERLSNLQSRIEQMVDRVMPAGGFGPRSGVTPGASPSPGTTR
jgi:ribosomal protein S20